MGYSSARRSLFYSQQGGLYREYLNQKLGKVLPQGTFTHLNNLIVKKGDQAVVRSAIPWHETARNGMDFDNRYCWNPLFEGPDKESMCASSSLISTSAFGRPNFQREGKSVRHTSPLGPRTGRCGVSAKAACGPETRRAHNVLAFHPDFEERRAQ